MATGLVSDNGHMYACGSSGGMISGWALVNGHWYYKGDGGALFRGKWLLSGGKWYYFDNASCEMETGLIDVGDMRYFALDSGAMATSEWVFFDAGCALASASGVLYETFSVLRRCAAVGAYRLLTRPGSCWRFGILCR